MDGELGVAHEMSSGGAMDEEKGEAAERGQGAVCELVPCAPPRCWPGSRQRTGWDRRG